MNHVNDCDDIVLYINTSLRRILRQSIMPQQFGFRREKVSKQIHMKRINSIILAMLLFMCGCFSAAEPQADRSEDHVIGILLVKEGETLPDEYEMSNSDIAARRSCLSLVYDPVNNLNRPYGEPYMLGNDTRIDERGAVLHPIWAVSQYSEISEAQVWLVHYDNGRIYAVNSNETLIKDGEIYHYNDDYGLSIDAELITIQVFDKNMGTSFHEYKEDGTALGSYHCFYGNITDLTTYTASEKTASVEVTGTVRLNDSVEWTDVLSADSKITFTALVENGIYGFLQCQKWLIDFAE